MSEGKKITEMTEPELRDLDLETPDSMEDLVELIADLVEREHDYGTCVYAMSLSAYAAFLFVSRKLGVTGAQASMADLDILKRTRRLKRGFMLLDYEKLLYPQHCNQDEFPTHEDLIGKNIETLSVAAKELLEKNREFPAHPEVKAHWKLLVEMGEEAKK